MAVKARHLVHALLVATATFLAGCTSPYSTPQFYPQQPIVGVRQLLESHGEVDIITIHGMCTHDGKWAHEAINALAEQLGDKSRPKIEPFKFPDFDALIYKRQLNLDGKKVNISAIVWSPILTDMKKGLCYDQKHKTGLCAEGEEQPDFLEKPIESPTFEESRAKINGGLKDSILDDCLADAMAYQGAAREEISKQVQEAILVAAVPGNEHLHTLAEKKEKAEQRKTPLVIFTSSLGSKVGFDAIKALREPNHPKDAALATIERTKTIFMAANQIPILQLADMTLKSSAEVNALVAAPPKDSLAQLLKDYQAAVRKEQQELHLREVPAKLPTVVVLSDPNDVLSYSLRNSPRRPEYPFVDVVVSNDWTWFGLLESPLSAHREYLVQPQIADLVMNGYTP